MSNRDTYKYHVKKGNKILHTGITNDLQRRENEHRQRYGDSVKLVPEGRRTTRDAAIQWEADQRKKGKPVGP